MIPEIRNPWIRRPLLVFSVAAIIVCIGPIALLNTALEWVEDEFEVDLRKAWRGPEAEGTK